ncbi:hypothetical protein U27_01720 [Candidatus Vecturithrix granuli]|uniref:Uncharacterized protein n=1 Tax=Vecturithrix granuli TaxID=1499967 RepID=A0A0S6W9L7_VECG1|nr:hypothetical protein U27_01720 [Candidatus Vecturithrix granuli]
MINLPSGAFKPYSGVGTAALIFEKPLPGGGVRRFVLSFFR